MRTIAIGVHIFVMAILAVTGYMTLTRLESKKRNFIVLFTFGCCILTLGIILQLMAITVEEAIIGMKVSYLGGALAIPSFFVSIQHYCQKTLPKWVNYLNVASNFFVMLIIWIPGWRPILYSSIHLYSEGLANGIYAWGVTRGVLYPYVRMNLPIVLVISLLLLIMKARCSNATQRKNILVLISIIVVCIIPNIVIVFFPVLFTFNLLISMLSVATSCVLLYFLIFRFDMRENEEAVRLQNTITDMIANISHDLKTPLTVLSVSLDKLRKVSADNPTKYQYAQVAYNKNLDLQRLIQNLIEVTRIESAQNLYNLELVSLNDILSDIQKKYSDHLENIGLSFDVGSDGGNALILTDISKIWSVFDNIIYNSIRHTQTGGITITARTKKKTKSTRFAGREAAEDDTVTITITDTGCGIAPEHLPRIFERFYKVEPNSGSQSGESGLGLYIVKSIMEGSRGKVEMISKPGVGASVILTFICKYM